MAAGGADDVRGAYWRSVTTAILEALVPGVHDVGVIIIGGDAAGAIADVDFAVAGGLAGGGGVYRLEGEATEPIGAGTGLALAVDTGTTGWFGALQNSPGAGAIGAGLAEPAHDTAVATVDGVADGFDTGEFAEFRKPRRAAVGFEFFRGADF